MARKTLQNIVLKNSYPDSFEAFFILYTLLYEYSNNQEYPWLDGEYKDHKEYYTRSFRKSILDRKNIIDLIIRLFELGMIESLIFSVFCGFQGGKENAEQIYRYNYSDILQQGVEGFQAIFPYTAEDIQKTSIYLRINVDECKKVFYEQISHWLKNYHFTQDYDQANSLYEIGLALNLIIQFLQSGKSKNKMKIDLDILKDPLVKINAYRPFVFLEILGDIEILQIGCLSSEDREIKNDIVISLQESFYQKYFYKEEIFLSDIWQNFCLVLKQNGYSIIDKNTPENSFGILKIKKEFGTIEIIQTKVSEDESNDNGFVYYLSTESLHFNNQGIKFGGVSKLLFNGLMDNLHLHTGICFDDLADIIDQQFSELNTDQQSKIYKKIRDAIASINNKIASIGNEKFFLIKDSNVYLNSEIKLNIVE